MAEYVMYILVNSTLKMGKGKIASQCCHSACRITRIYNGMHSRKYQQWLQNGEAKIVLKCAEEQLQAFINRYSYRGINEDIWCVEIRDMGKTQIKPDSLTAVAFCIMSKEQAPKEIKELKLL